MKKKFVAFLREENSLRELIIADVGKPTVDPTFAKRWQGVINLIAMEANEPVALILRVTQDAISNLSKNDYGKQTDFEANQGNGLYCESELGKSGLLIASRALEEDAGEEPVGMPSITACFGLPIQWPDESLFGLICVLNNQGKALKPTYRNILSGIKATIEQELILLENQSKCQIPVQAQPQTPAPQATETDALTSLYSRSKIEDILKHEFERAKRYLKTFSVTMIDLNGFQKINDSFGREAGDEILKAFAQSVGSKIRETDFWGRWSGDAFVLVCPYADTVETQQMFARIKPSVNQDMKAAAAFSDFSFGVSQYEPDDLSVQAIVKRAEENMLQYKEIIKRKAVVAYDR
jgi:diguanylate cyclase (GGDEF)-like protein